MSVEFVINDGSYQFGSFVKYVISDQNCYQLSHLSLIYLYADLKFSLSKMMKCKKQSHMQREKRKTTCVYFFLIHGNDFDDFDVFVAQCVLR